MNKLKNQNQTLREKDFNMQSFGESDVPLASRQTPPRLKEVKHQSYARTEKRLKRVEIDLIFTHIVTTKNNAD
jgi:hypothetical protein